MWQAVVIKEGFKSACDLNSTVVRVLEQCLYGFDLELGHLGFIFNACCILRPNSEKVA